MTTHTWIPTANGMVELPTGHTPTPAAQLVIGSATSGGRLALIATVEVPGREPPCHRHLERDTLLYVVTGEIALYRAGTNVAPTVGPITAPTVPLAVTTAVKTSAAFTDAGTADTHTAVWDWGDGTISAGTISAGTVGGSRTYAAPGVYTVKLTVQDDDGGAGSATYQYVVVYDPSGGFVTGGGWIDSPKGASIATPDLTGRATFGFVAKYQKGATKPSGQTQFQFHAGDLNFHSTAYEWLVVAGPKAQYKGTGTINGTGSYGFLLTAIDGQLNGGGGTDRFRIKIWDTASGAIVYDNQRGATDDAAVTTALQGGSIVIHAGK